MPTAGFSPLADLVELRPCRAPADLNDTRGFSRRFQETSGQPLWPQGSAPRQCSTHCQESRWDYREGQPPASTLAKACAYSLKHWEALTRFLGDGILPLDNNLCEQQIRSLALGRRNYLFAGSDAGAERAAVLYSLLRTCALHHVDAFAYLTDVLRKLASGWLAKRLDELLPENWSPAAKDPIPETAPVV